MDEWLGWPNGAKILHTHIGLTEIFPSHFHINWCAPGWAHKRSAREGSPCSEKEGGGGGPYHTWVFRVKIFAWSRNQRPITSLYQGLLISYIISSQYQQLLFNLQQTCLRPESIFMAIVPSLSRGPPASVATTPSFSGDQTTKPFSIWKLH